MLTRWRHVADRPSFGPRRLRRDIISVWRREAVEYEYTTEVLGIDPGGDDQYVARVHLKENFPGGEVDLRYQFTFVQDSIVRLRIAP